MPTDQITLKFDAQTSSAASALQELTAPIEKLSSEFSNLSASISKDLVSSLKAVSEPLNSVSKSFSVLGSGAKDVKENITGAVSALKQISSGGLSSELGKTIQQLDTLAQSPAAKGFDSLAISMQRLGSGVSAISSATNKTKSFSTSVLEIANGARQLITAYDGLGGLGQKLKNVEGVEQFASKWTQGFSQITPLITRFSNSIKVLEAVGNKRIKLGAVDAFAFRKSITEIIASLTKLFSAFDLSGDSGSKNFSDKFKDFEKIIPVFDKFSNSLVRIQKVSNNSSKILEEVQNSLIKLVSGLGELPSKSLSSFERLADSMYRLAEGMKYLRATTKSASSVVERANKVLQGTSSSATTATKSLHWLSGGWKSVVTAFAGGTVIYSTVRFIKEAAQAFLDLDREMRLVNVVVRGSEENLASMTKEVLDLSSQFGLASQKIAKALYEINQATIVGADSLEVLRNASKMAVAGNTDVDKSSKLLSATLKAYAKSVNESSYLSDIFFKIQERGIITIDELTQYGQRLFATFSSAGIPMEELGAALSTLTTRGLQANIAVTALNSLVLKLSSGSKKLNKIFEMTGDYTSANALRTKGLAYTMRVLQNATNGSLSSLTRLGFNYRDIRAATILANDIGGVYAENLSIFSDRTQIAGSSQKAYNEILKSFSQQLREIKEALSASIVQIVDFVGKWSGLSSVITLIRNFINSTNPVIAAISTIASSVLKAVSAFTIIVGSIALVVGIVVKAKAALVSLIRSFIAMMASTKENTASLGVFGTGLKTVAGLFSNATQAVRAYVRELIRLNTVSRLQRSGAGVAGVPNFSMYSGFGYYSTDSQTGQQAHRRMPEKGFYEIDPRTFKKNFGTVGNTAKNAVSGITAFRTSFSSLGKIVPAVVAGLKGVVLGIKAFIASIAGGLIYAAAITAAFWAIGKAIEAIKTRNARKELSSLRDEFNNLKTDINGAVSLKAKSVGLEKIDTLQKRMLALKDVLGENSAEFNKLQAEMNKFRESLGKVVSSNVDAQIQLALSKQTVALNKAYRDSFTSGQQLAILQNELSIAVQKYNELQSSKAPAEAIAAQIDKITELRISVMKLEQQVLNTQFALVKTFSARFTQTEGTNDLDTYQLKVARLRDIFTSLQKSGATNGIDFNTFIKGDYTSVVLAFDKLRKNIDSVALSMTKMAQRNYISVLSSELTKININTNLAYDKISSDFANSIRNASDNYNKALMQYQTVLKNGSKDSMLGILDLSASVTNLYNAYSNLSGIVGGKKYDAELKYLSDIENGFTTLLKLRNKLASSKEALTQEDWAAAERAVYSINRLARLKLVGTAKVSDNFFNKMYANGYRGVGENVEFNKKNKAFHTIPKYSLAAGQFLFFSEGSELLDGYFKDFSNRFAAFVKKTKINFSKIDLFDFTVPDTRVLTARLQSLYDEAQKLASSLPNEAVLRSKDALEVWQAAFNKATDYGKLNMLNEKIAYFSQQVRSAATFTEKLLAQKMLNKFTNDLDKVNENIRKREDSIRNTYNRSLSPVASAREATSSIQTELTNYSRSYYNAAGFATNSRSKTLFNTAGKQIGRLFVNLQAEALKGGQAVIDFRKRVLSSLKVAGADTKMISFFEKTIDRILKSGVLLSEKYRKQIQDKTQSLYEKSLPEYKKELLVKRRLAAAEAAITAAQSPKERVAAFEEYQRLWKEAMGFVKKAPNLSPEVKTSQAIVAGSQEAYNLLKRSERHDYNLDIARNTSLIYNYLRQKLTTNAARAGITIITG